jgi:hypothetical protein
MLDVMIGVAPPNAIASCQGLALCVASGLAGLRATTTAMPSIHELRGSAAL